MGVDLPPFTLSRHADTLGSGRKALARAVTAEDLERVRRGVHVDATLFAGLTREDLHLLRMHAVDTTVHRRLVFSHWSAAVAHGLPLLGGDAVHASVDPGSNHRIVGVTAHRYAVDDQDVVTRHGVLVTTLDRTVIDVACSAPFIDAVAVADAALHTVEPHRREAVREAWRNALTRVGIRRSERKALDVIDFADGNSGSVAESASRVTMRALHLPPPVLQQRFFDDRGFVAEVDFWFPHVHGVGEADGLVKYTDPGMTGGDPGHVVYREKIREDRVRALVSGFARWDYATARSPQLLGPRLARLGVLPTC